MAPHLGGHDIDDGDDIFALGYVNSLFAMQLVSFVEKEFTVEVGPEDMVFNNFRTVDGIVRLVDSKKTASA